MAKKPKFFISNTEVDLFLKTPKSKVFYAPFHISSVTDIIYLNGLLQTEGIGNDYTFKRNRIKVNDYFKLTQRDKLTVLRQKVIVK